MRKLEQLFMFFSKLAAKGLERQWQRSIVVINLKYILHVRPAFNRYIKELVYMQTFSSRLILV